jgi:endonuclease/exonuclease/phosphatase family metal-dependent hydrolase
MLRLLCIVLLIVQTGFTQAWAKYFSYSELKRLSEYDRPLERDLKKLAHFFNHPVVFNRSLADNSKSLSFIDSETKLVKKQYVEAPPLVKTSNNNFKFNHKINKPYFRVAAWNIGRGYQVPEIAQIFTKDMTKYEASFKNEEKLLAELKHFKKVDILLLNEADIGLPRTNYLNTVEVIADAMSANYTWVPEFFEVDDWTINDPHIDQHLLEGIHANAIISKYPIISSFAVRLPNCYDWFHDEQAELSPVEKSKRAAASVILKENFPRELRRGSRVALVADVRLPNQQIYRTVSTHLENRCKPACRANQINTMLEALKDSPYPLVLGGDFNTFDRSGGPVTARALVTNRITDPSFITKVLIAVLVPYALIVNTAYFTLSKTRNYLNPTLSHIPVFFPNRAHQQFKVVEKFKFDDGLGFDDSGSDEFSYNSRDGKWSNSNQRGLKGFKETFTISDLLLAKYKIDWLFVKPVHKAKSVAYHPALGRTLQELNEKFLVEKSLSDHNPVTVDILID